MLHSRIKSDGYILKNVTALYHIAAPGVPDSVMRDKAAQAALALEGQQMILLRLQHEDASRDALCQEVPGSLPAAANGVLTCDRGAAAVDAMMVAAKVGLMICSTLYEAASSCCCSTCGCPGLRSAASIAALAVTLRPSHVSRCSHLQQDGNRFLIILNNSMHV